MDEKPIPVIKFIGCEVVYDSSSCRICLSSGAQHQLFDISDNKKTMNTLSYLEKLMACVPSLNITDSDPYPQYICHQCIQLLNQSYEFYLLCTQSDQKLRDSVVQIDSGRPLTDFDSESNILKSPDQEDVKPVKVRKNAAKKTENGKYIRKHNRIPNHKCDICGKMMFGSVALILHIRSHTGERPYVCEVCGKSFKTPGCLKDHLESHTMNRPERFTCPLCPYKTHRPIEIRRHAVVHTTERPFECDICKRKFKTKIILRHHTDRVHSQKFPCELCEDKFTSIRGLQAHVKNHYSSKQYRCLECKRLYGRFKSLTYHVKRSHPNLQRPKQADVLVGSNDLTNHTV